MISDIQWRDGTAAAAAASGRSFQLISATRSIPGVLWLPPPGREPTPALAMLGHGGSGHKRSDRITQMARWFAAAGIASVAIDGPFHGERVPAPLEAADYQDRIAADGIDVVLDQMTKDWIATVDAIGTLGIADSTRLGYLGMSMGTRFGLPVAAALGERLRCVVLGKFGLQQSPMLHPGLNAAARAEADARSITAPILFHIQWEDEIFPRDGQVALFDAFGSRDKQLLAYSGNHGHTPPGAIIAWRDFLSRHL